MEFTKEQVDAILTRVDNELSDRHINRQKFYDGSGVSSSSYSQWRTGVRKPSVVSVQRMAAYLDVPVDYLLTGDRAYYPADDSEEVKELREMLLNRPDAKILFGLVKDAPPSAVYEAVATLARFKEQSEFK